MSEQYYQKPLVIAYSGGKDSDVLLDLAIKANINIKVVHSHTTLDAPQTVYHVRNVFERLNAEGIKTEIIYPTTKGKRTSMWQIIPEKGFPPTRTVRYCCRILKETTTPQSFVATGVRADESRQRMSRNMFEIKGHKKTDIIRHDFAHIKEVYAEAQIMPDVYDCQYISKVKQNKDAIVNPLINWSDKDIYTYIRQNNIELCELYNQGYTRVGCIGCPMAGKRRYKEFRDFPSFKHNYILAFERMLQGSTNSSWKNGQEVFEWWMEEKNIKGQLAFDFKENYEKREVNENVAK